MVENMDTLLEFSVFEFAGVNYKSFYNREIENGNIEYIYRENGSIISRI